MPSSYLYLNGLRIHYLYWNRESGGMPAILLHGLASNARIWEKVAPYLAQGGLASLAPDLRGHGLTDKPDGDYDFETHLRDLVALLDAWDVERPLLVGHSWGAMLVLDYAARFTFGQRAPSGIVLVDGGMSQLDDSPGATWEQVQARLTPPNLAGYKLLQFLKILNDGQAGWRPDDQSLSIILSNFEINEDNSPGDETITPLLSFAHHMQIVRAMWEFKTYERYRHLRCPVLMVPANPPESHNLQRNEHLARKKRGIKQAEKIIQDLQVYWMADTIHDIPLQRPAELGELILSFRDRLEAEKGR
jgi:pimeloyl-ACP methyl ester carboxylesterase